MKIEDQLKKLILSRYKSINEFVQRAELPYSTVDSIFRRGIGNSSVTNVIKICKVLGISVDELANGRIVPNSYYTSKSRDIETDIDSIIADTKTKLVRGCGLTIDGKPIDDEDLSSIINAIDIGVEIAKRKKRAEV